MKFYTVPICEAYKNSHGLKQTIRVMKLVAFFIGIFCMHAAASVTAQSITLSARQATLKKVSEEIQKQSNYIFFYESGALDHALKVTVELKNETLKQALEKCFAGQPLTYKIIDRTVLVQQKSRGVLERMAALFQKITITGRVEDEQGLPLPGASIKASGHSTVSDSKGQFSLAGVDELTEIEVSYIGYQTIRIKASRGFMLIKMEKSTGELQETVIKGYYTTTKTLNTGNVSSVRAEDLSKQPVTDPLAALQGRVPGLFIQQNSGAPGRSFTVQLRGQNSIANGNDPLYIVDGIPFNSAPLNPNGIGIIGTGANSSPLNDLNVNDIESIDVLKDADATAIYGSRGANGVILITTKKGKAGKSEASFNLYTGAGKITRRLDLLNTQQYLDIRRKALANDQLTPGPSDYDLNGSYDLNKYTDWEDVLIGGTAKVTDLQGAISGGSEFTQFRVGMDYHNETTVYPGNNGSQKTSGQVAVNHRSENGKFKADFTTSYVLNSTELPPQDLTTFIFTAPNAPDIYDASGKLNWANSTWQNPLYSAFQPYKETSNNLISNLRLGYELLPGLRINSSFGYNHNELNTSKLIPYSSLDPAVWTNPITARENDRANATLNKWIIEPQISYERPLWIGKLELLAGSTIQQSHQESLTQSAYGFTTDALIPNFAAGSTVKAIENSVSDYRYNAYYARAGYSIADKYVLNLTGRRDGSSRFGPGRQYGNFGAIGAAWVFGKEKFIAEHLPFLSFGKLRGSIGSTGNDQLGDYKYLSTYSSYTYSYQGANGLYPTQLTNPLFSWERVNKIEAALELGLFNDRILLNTSWYRNRTSNQLVGYSLPGITGFRTVQANLPAVIQNTGLEFELQTTNIQTKDFKWTTSANLSFPRNKLVSYPNILGSSYASRYAVGQPLSVRFMYIYTGIDPATGLYTFQDQNGDHQITFDKDKVPVFIGQKFFGGVSNSFKYKNLQLDVMLTFAKQNGGYTPFVNYPGAFQGADNQPASILTSKDIQPFDTSYANFETFDNFLNSNGILTDASYIRVKNVSLSYTLPKDWQAIRFMKSARIYLQAQNLFTITKFKGLDPEANQVGKVTLPPLRMITAGIQFSL